jgi:small ligand-binding sensory domain FIST
MNLKVISIFLIPKIIWQCLCCFCCFPGSHAFLAWSSYSWNRHHNKPIRHTTSSSLQDTSSSNHQHQQRHQWFQNTVTNNNDTTVDAAMSELLNDWEFQQEEALAFLFISNHWDLQDVVMSAKERLGENTNLLTIVGGGVIGQHEEYEDTKSLSILGGPISSTSPSSSSSLKVFSVSNHNAMLPKFRSNSSLFLFSDPYCCQIQKVLHTLEEQNCLAAGGVSVPPPSKQKTQASSSSLAINQEILPQGSLMGVELPPSLVLQCVVSQGGCRPIGPTYTVTSVEGPAVHELDQVRAIDQLEGCSERLSQQDQELVRTMGVLGGIYNTPAVAEEEGEFMVRQVTGFRPRSGSILVCGQPQIQQGDLFRFHVRSSAEALEDWKLILERAQTERMFLDQTHPNILCGMQISSLARGKDFFQQPNVDLEHAQQLLQWNKQDRSPLTPPIGGFFSNAEIGPVGIRMGATADKSKAYLHGFATVVAMLCESNSSSGDEEENDTLLSSVME